MTKNKRTRAFQAAKLLLRDEAGHPNEDALRVFETEYAIARGEGCHIQLSAELAMRRALGR